MHPFCARTVVAESRSILELVFTRIHDKPPLVVIACQLYGVEGRRYILPAKAEESPDGDNQRLPLAGVVYNDVLNCPDLVVRGIIDVLLVEISNSDAIIGRCGQRPFGPPSN